MSWAYINYTFANSGLKERSRTLSYPQANKIDERSQGQSEFLIIQVGNLLEDLFQKWEKDINTSKEEKFLCILSLSSPIFMVKIDLGFACSGRQLHSKAISRA